jgi:hypothetical protein
MEARVRAQALTVGVSRRRVLTLVFADLPNA